MIVNGYVSIFVLNIDNQNEFFEYILKKKGFFFDTKIDSSEIDKKYLKCKFLKEKTNNLKELLSGFTYDKNIIKHMNNKKIVLDNVYNAIVCIYNYDYKHNDFLINSKLKYIGSFYYTSNDLIIRNNKLFYYYNVFNNCKTYKNLVSFFNELCSSKFILPIYDIPNDDYAIPNLKDNEGNVLIPIFSEKEKNDVSKDYIITDIYDIYNNKYPNNDGIVIDPYTNPIIFNKELIEEIANGEYKSWLDKEIYFRYPTFNCKNVLKYLISIAKNDLNIKKIYCLEVVNYTIPAKKTLLIVLKCVDNEEDVCRDIYRQLMSMPALNFEYLVRSYKESKNSIDEFKSFYERKKIRTIIDLDSDECYPYNKDERN